VTWVEPSDEPGRSRWSGSGGALSLEVCQAIRAVVSVAGAGATGEVASRRARNRLDEVHDEHWFTREIATSAQHLTEQSRTCWWTWAGGRANAEIGRRLRLGGQQLISVDDLSVTVAGLHTGHELRQAAADDGATPAEIDPRRLHAIKFQAAAPPAALEAMCRLRDADDSGVAEVLSQPVESVSPAP
jgi:ATP-dependent Lhr-like helicase